MSAKKLLEKQLQDLDKDIQEAETALEHLQKQIGKKISKIGYLKDKRHETSLAYLSLKDDE